MEDVLKATALLRDMKAKADEISAHVSSMIEKVEDEQISSNKVCVEKKQYCTTNY